MSIKVVGWDIGGAHLKAAAVDDNGAIVAVIQEACPLWQGMDRLHWALDRVMARLSLNTGCLHAATMTGELADIFETREQGVAALVRVMAERCPRRSLWFFAGLQGFLTPDAVAPHDTSAIASANWLASGLWAAVNLPEALFVDVGSTTSDLLLIHHNRPAPRGYTDHERMRYDELLYSGIVRTPVMALAGQVPFEGHWVGLMAEHFATAADIYRLTGELPEDADQLATADGGPKTVEASRRRLARMLGRDAEAAPAEHWRAVAAFLRERQLERLHASTAVQLSRGLLSSAAPLVGAGVGRFLVRELARRLHNAYLDFSDLFSISTAGHDLLPADCAPAAAVACLALREVGHQ